MDALGFGERGARRCRGRLMLEAPLGCACACRSSRDRRRGAVIACSPGRGARRHGVGILVLAAGCRHGVHVRRLPVAAVAVEGNGANVVWGEAGVVRWVRRGLIVRRQSKEKLKTSGAGTSRNMAAVSAQGPFCHGQDTGLVCRLQKLKRPVGEAEKLACNRSTSVQPSGKRGRKSQRLAAEIRPSGGCA